MIRYCPVVVAAVLALFGLDVSPIGAQPAKLSWTQLDWSGGLFGKAQLRLETISGEQAADRLISPGADRTVSSPGAEVLFMTLGFKVPLSESFLELWLDPDDVEAFQRVERDRKDRQKTYRFTPEGVAARIASPAGDAEKDLPPEQWTAISHDFYPYDAPDAGPLVVTESPALFYIVSCIDPPAVNIHVWFKKRLFTVEVALAGTKTLKVDYLEVVNGEERQRKEALEASRFTVRARPVADGDTETEFELMGLKGDIEILVDRASRLPVQLRGKMGFLGKVKVKLESVVIGPGPECPGGRNSLPKLGL